MLSDEFRIAVLLVTHDPETTRICTRTLTMHDGAIQVPDSE
jgi:ABC-type lipoprotein export system ATPase subunit